MQFNNESKKNQVKVCLSIYVRIWYCSANFVIYNDFYIFLLLMPAYVYET